MSAEFRTTSHQESADEILPSHDEGQEILEENKQSEKESIDETMSTAGSYASTEHSNPVSVEYNYVDDVNQASGHQAIEGSQSEANDYESIAGTNPAYDYIEVIAEPRTLMSKCKKTILFLVPIFASVIVNIIIGFYTSLMFFLRVDLRRDSREDRKTVPEVLITFCFFSALAAASCAPLMIKYGFRKVTLGGSGLLICFFYFSSLTTTADKLSIPFGIMGGFAVGLLRTIGVVATVDLPYTRPALALFISYTSSTVGNIIGITAIVDGPSHGRDVLAISAVMGLVAAASCAPLMIKYGFRKVTLGGSGLLICFFYFSSLTTTADILSIPFGIMGGFAVGLLRTIGVVATVDLPYTRPALALLISYTSSTVGNIIGITAIVDGPSHGRDVLAISAVMGLVAGSFLQKNSQTQQNASKLFKHLPFYFLLSIRLAASVGLSILLPEIVIISINGWLIFTCLFASQFFVLVILVTIQHFQKQKLNKSALLLLGLSVLAVGLVMMAHQRAVGSTLALICLFGVATAIFQIMLPLALVNTTGRSNLKLALPVLGCFEEIGGLISSSFLILSGPRSPRDDAANIKISPANGALYFGGVTLIIAGVSAIIAWVLIKRWTPLSDESEEEDHVEDRVEEADDSVENRVDKAEKHVEDHVEETGDHVEEAEDHVEEIEDHVEETEDQVEEADDHVGETEDHVEETEGHVEVTEDHVEETEDHFEETEDHVEETQDHVEETEDFVRETEDHVEETEDHVGETDDHVGETEDHVEETEGHVEETEDMVEEAEDTGKMETEDTGN